MRIATVSGRYYAMDRDKRWDRVGKAYEALVDAKGERAADAKAAIAQSYAAGKTDEFVLPTVDRRLCRDERRRRHYLLANFRADRVREILTALVDPDFKDFARARVVAIRRSRRHGRIFRGAQPPSR